MGRKHTKARMKTTAVLPKLAARDMRAAVGGAPAGRPSTTAPSPRRAASWRSPTRPSGTTTLDANIREHFAGLVAGDATPLEALQTTS